MTLRIPKLRSSSKLIILSCFAALNVIILIAALLFLYHQSMMEDRQQKVHDMVESVYRLVEFYHGKIDKEGLSESDAKRFVFQTIRELPYDANGYCWINDMKGIMLMHPIIPLLDGKDMYDVKDSNGAYYFHEFIDTVKQKQAGFVRYTWPKPDNPEGESYPKLSYVKGFTPWGWIIGSGIYIDDVDTAFRHAIFVSGGLVISLAVFIIALFLTFSEGMKKP